MWFTLLKTSQYYYPPSCSRVLTLYKRRRTLTMTTFSSSPALERLFADVSGWLLLFYYSEFPLQRYYCQSFPRGIAEITQRCCSGLGGSTTLVDSLEKSDDGTRSFDFGVIRTRDVRQFTVIYSGDSYLKNSHLWNFSYFSKIILYQQFLL